MRNLERRIADVLRKAATRVAEGEAERRADRRGGRARGARAAPLRRRGAQAHLRPRRRDRARGHRGRRRRPLHRGDRVPGQGRPADHRPARRGDAGVGAGGALLGAQPRRASSASTRTGSPSTTSTSTSRPARCPKDGPSAGITMATAIVSLATGRTVSEDVGMTGEITLTGQVLPIGGVREKVLAAQRAGLKRVILPRENEADLSELPEETREELDVRARRRRPTRCSRRRSTAASSARPRAGARSAQAASATDEAYASRAGRRRPARRRRLAPAAESWYSSFPRRTKVIRSTRSPWATSYCRARLPAGDVDRPPSSHPPLRAWPRVGSRRGRAPSPPAGRARAGRASRSGRHGHRHERRRRPAAAAAEVGQRLRASSPRAPEREPAARRRV